MCTYDKTSIISFIFNDYATFCDFYLSTYRTSVSHETNYIFMAEHNEIGKIGENITTEFLMKQGFSIVERNYRIRQGELDIVARKDDVLHFVEVKSIKVRDCSHITDLTISPEDNLTLHKWSKLLVAVESYLRSQNVPHETKYQIDLACVYIDTEKREGRVKLLLNINKE